MQEGQVVEGEIFPKRNFWYKKIINKIKVVEVYRHIFTILNEQQTS